MKTNTKSNQNGVCVGDRTPLPEGLEGGGSGDGAGMVIGAGEGMVIPDDRGM